MTKIHHIIDELNSTSKRNEKVRILQDNKQNDLLKKVFYYALNPYYSYGIKKIPSYTYIKSCYSISDFIQFLDELRERSITGNAAIQRLGHYLSHMHPDEAIVASNMVNKDLRCGTSTATVNSVWKNLIPTYPCLLAESYSRKLVDENIKFPAISQLKSDGVRVNIFVFRDSVTLKSRSGRPIDILGKFSHLSQYAQEEAPFVLDGELLVVDKDNNILPRKMGNGIINKAIKGTIKDDEASRVIASVWDLIPYSDFINCYCDIPYIQRFNSVVNLTDNNIDCITVIPSMVVDNIEEAQKHFSEMLSSGEEGTMLKDINHVWENRRSKKVLKMKSELECELLVIDWLEGTGKYKGMLGNITCVDLSRSVTVNVGSGFSDEQRKTISKNDIVGRIVTIRYNEKIQSDSKETDSLFLPRFIEVRMDKDDPDDLSSL